VICLQHISYTSLNDEEKKALDNIARALRYFAINRSYGYVDRLANVYSISALRHVLSEIMRDLHSEYSRGMNVYLPSEKDLEIFLRLAEKDLSLVKIVVALALSYTYPSARGD